MAFLGGHLDSLAAAGLVAAAPKESADSTYNQQLYQYPARGPAVALSHHTLALSRHVRKPGLGDTQYANMPEPMGDTAVIGYATTIPNGNEYISTVTAGTSNISINANLICRAGLHISRVTCMLQLVIVFDTKTLEIMFAKATHHY
ncbi:hypothetical protein F503_08578 [Ophiostoma piceae UAMH 11346]|uniref:Uncharacterized protein n=1 Tax=Ophiostoma piceae (strain UAMH 11346) TaxID=1262450 RepID=S3BSB9_OPHP1|nr:hypothetical protein F503_08578 [Ophiostoma piceae UAMH 11346]